MNAVATKKQRGAQAAGSKPQISATPDQPVTVVAQALTALVQQAKAGYDGAMGPEAVCIHAHTLIDLALEELDKLAAGKSEDEGASVYRVAACLAGARAHDKAESPNSTARHAVLQQAYEAAESASISFGFVEEPCEALAQGIKVGQALAKPSQSSPSEGESDDEKRIRIAFDANYSIQELAKALKAHHMRTSCDDWPVYNGTLGQIQQLSEVVFCALRLGGTDRSMTYPSLETLQRFMDGHFTLIVRDEK